MLRAGIISGSLEPGDRLVEQKLARKMGIGQPTLREALKQLEHQGFVRKIPQRGTYVTKLDQQDYRKVLEVRTALEALAVGLAARNIDAAAESEMQSLVKEMAEATDHSDLARFHEADVAFHRKIWDLADNEYVAKALEAVTFPLFAFALLDLRPELLRQRSAAVREHEGILAGLRSRNPLEARRAFVAETAKDWKDVYHIDLLQDTVDVGNMTVGALSEARRRKSG